MRVLVLGGYGFLGSEIVRSLAAAGHSVVGLGRSPDIGRRKAPQVTWIGGDLAALQSAASWHPIIEGVDVVVNAAGVLQDGLRDDVDRVHHGAIDALVGACGDKISIRLVHISAPGASIGSTSGFMRSKARGDAAIRASGIDWVILRPGLVLGREAYGGSALLRAVAAFPFVLPIALADARVQTAALADVAGVVREAVEGGIPSHCDLDLVEIEPHTLRYVVERLRAWMGIPTPVAVIRVPLPAARLLAKGADLMGYLGWRPPLRTTALRVLSDGVTGDPEPFRALRGRSLRSIDCLLEDTPSLAQERLFARSYLLMPLIVATLAIFWVASGVVALLDVDRAASAIPADALPKGLARWLVLAGAAVDLALGLAIVVRPFARLAGLGMALVSVLYLSIGTLLAPMIWLDPLGPFVKVLPIIVLALATVAMIGER